MPRTSSKLTIRFAASAAICLICCHAALASDFSSPRYGYSLMLPDGWTQIPDDVLQETMRSMQGGQSKESIVYDAGFQLDAAAQWLEYPYVLVQPIRLPRPLREDEMAEAALAFTGMDFSDVLDQHVGEGVRHLLGDVQPGHVRFDKSNRRFLWELNMDVEGIGPVRGSLVGYFGQEALIQVGFYARAADWQQYAHDRQAILGSFDFVSANAMPDLQLSGAHPDIRRFLSGERDTFNSRDHPKAKSVHLTMSYPHNWRASEGERPNVVQKFVGDGGRGLEMAAILIVDFPLPLGTILSYEDQRDLFAPSELRGMLPSNAAFITAEQTLIDGIPAGSVDYVVHSESAGMKISLYTWGLFFIADEKLVQIQFCVGGPATSEAELSGRMDELRPLFRLMANSIVLPSRWTNPLTNPTGASTQSGGLPYDDPELLLPVLLVNLVVTWIIGLAPPLAVRYVIMRRPLSRKGATWIAVLSCAIFWLGFQAVSHSTGERAGSGVVWMLVFFVARWIMSREYMEKATETPLTGGSSSSQSLSAAGTLSPSSHKSSGMVESADTITQGPEGDTPTDSVPGSMHSATDGALERQAVPITSESKGCPNCRLVNPGHAERCDCGYHFYEREASESRSGPNGIGGWLILPAIGLILSPFLVCGGIGQNMTLLDSDMMRTLDVQYPTFRSAIVGQTFLSIAFLVLQLFVAVSFFMKKPFVPGLMVVYLSLNVAIVLLAYVWTASIVGAYPEGITEVTRASLLAVVWIPYFLVSKRVKNTFGGVTQLRTHC